MASVQEEQPGGSTSILRNEDKEVVEQMMKEAEKVLLTENPNMEKVKVQIAGCILNVTNGSRLQILNKHDWCGQASVRAAFPPEIPIGGTAKFVHHGLSLQGSKAAVVYASLTFNTAWLLAWSVPVRHDHPNKVYVEDGPKEKYNAIDWCEIERKLDASENTSSYEDTSTRCKSIVEISDSKTAKLGAMFLS